MVAAAVVGESEFWILILGEGKGEFQVQGEVMLACEKRRDFEEVLVLGLGFEEVPVL